MVKNRDQDLDVGMRVGGGGGGSACALIRPDMFFCEKVCSVGRVGIIKSPVTTIAEMKGNSCQELQVRFVSLWM